MILKKLNPRINVKSFIDGIRSRGEKVVSRSEDISEKAMNKVKYAMEIARLKATDKAIRFREYAKSLDWSVGNIVTNCFLVAGSLALTIFSPEIAVAFTAVYGMMLAQQLLRNQKPYVMALVGLGVATTSIILVHHIAEIAVFGTFKVAKDFYSDVRTKIQEKLEERELIRALDEDGGYAESVIVAPDSAPELAG